jgi:putative spermidine/putrescine transport system ATP-binding protein
MIRPERIRLGESAGARVRGVTENLQYFGSFWRAKIRCDQGTMLIADLAIDSALPAAGETVHLHWDDSAIHRLNEAGMR